MEISCNLNEKKASHILKSLSAQHQHSMHTPIDAEYSYNTSAYTKSDTIKITFGKTKHYTPSKAYGSGCTTTLCGMHR